MENMCVSPGWFAVNIDIHKIICFRIAVSLECFGNPRLQQYVDELNKIESHRAYINDTETLIHKVISEQTHAIKRTLPRCSDNARKYHNFGKLKSKVLSGKLDFDTLKAKCIFVRPDAGYIDGRQYLRRYIFDDERKYKNFKNNVLDKLMFDQLFVWAKGFQVFRDSCHRKTLNGANTKEYIVGKRLLRKLNLIYGDVLDYERKSCDHCREYKKVYPEYDMNLMAKLVEFDAYVEERQKLKDGHRLYVSALDEEIRTSDVLRPELRLPRTMSELADFVNKYNDTDVAIFNKDPLEHLLLKIQSLKQKPEFVDSKLFRNIESSVRMILDRVKDMLTLRDTPIAALDDDDMEDVEVEDYRDIDCIPTAKLDNYVISEHSDMARVMDNYEIDKILTDYCDMERVATDFLPITDMIEMVHSKLKTLNKSDTDIYERYDRLFNGLIKVSVDFIEYAALPKGESDFIEFRRRFSPAVVARQPNVMRLLIEDIETHIDGATDNMTKEFYQRVLDCTYKLITNSCAETQVDDNIDDISNTIGVVDEARYRFHRLYRVFIFTGEILNVAVSLTLFVAKVLGGLRH
jgi:hypothetical protein